MHPLVANTAEGRRLAADRRRWTRWGPYLAERAWGTVREDYSANGDAWGYFPHDHARSRAYRWNEDGLGGISDEPQRLCFAFALWNGQDPILKERIFGLTGPEGNHAEDAKEYWWYLDSTPTHSWMRWRYHYPQAAFPYDDLVAENRRRTRHDPEYELVDTGVFADSRYWIITVDYAKADSDDLCIRATITNHGPDPAPLHVLPTVWFRNVWSWGWADPRPSVRFEDGRVLADHGTLGRMVASSSGTPTVLVCDNESNAERLWGIAGACAHPKDAINDAVVHGAAACNPDRTGTKAAFHHVLSVASGATAELRLRLSDGATDLGAGWEAVMAEREREADEYYDALLPPEATAEERMIARQAFAGLLWTKQFYHFDVEHWLDGDPANPPPPASRLTGRDSGWRHLNNRDVLSMPDAWEYPWYASWDLAFHCVAFAHVDPEFAKHQLVLLCREWYMHPNGQLPAYEWAFSDVNPPVHAWAALRVFDIDGGTDYNFLSRVFHKLLLNFTWWVNRKDTEGNNVFEGGFLGLDNIGPLDRSAQLPVAGVLEQSDSTAWMAQFCLNLLEMALVLCEHDASYEDLATKFFEHFTYIATALDDGLWSEDDGFYFDVVRTTEGERVPLKVRSIVGLLPLNATTTLGSETLQRLPDFAFRLEWFEQNKPQFAAAVCHLDPSQDPGSARRLLAAVSPERLRRQLSAMLDPDEFLSPHGLRALSAYHRDHPFSLQLAGLDATVGYEPGESTTDLFGGNSNWRGPVWFPINYLLIGALVRFDRYLRQYFTVEYPKGSGRQRELLDVARDLADRLIGLYRSDADGNRPAFGASELFQRDPAWHDQLLFAEYFHGDTGAGLGATHQTGWTALIADLVIQKYRGVLAARE